MKLATAIQVLQQALKEDKDYRMTWQANIAMAYQDAEGQYKRKTGKKQLNNGDKHVVANNAADHFLTLLCK